MSTRSLDTWKIKINKSSILKIKFMTIVGCIPLYRKRNYDIFRRIEDLTVYQIYTKVQDRLIKVCKKNGKQQNTKIDTTHKPKVREFQANHKTDDTISK
jgi:hypothetical protein